MNDENATTDYVLLERRDPGIAILTLNRPERLNAWSEALGGRYLELLDQCATDPDVRVIVVTGAGKAFCAGADLDANRDARSTVGEAAARSASGIRPHHLAMMIPKPVIAAINGACAGYGLVQALMCDIRFAAAGAKFSTAFARIGLIADYGMSWILPRLVGTAHALDLLMSSRAVPAEAAATMGLVNEVVAPELVLDRALEYATQLARYSSPTSMALIKRQVHGDATRSLEAAVSNWIELSRTSLNGDDITEGIAAFVEKRLPSFAPYTDEGWRDR